MTKITVPPGTPRAWKDVLQARYSQDKVGKVEDISTVIQLLQVAEDNYNWIADFGPPASVPGAVKARRALLVQLSALLINEVEIIDKKKSDAKVA